MSETLLAELTNRLPTCRRGEGFADRIEHDEGQLSGRAVPYGVTIELAPSLFERFDRGAFKRQLDQPHRVKLCLEHGQVIGSVSELREEDDGLYFHGRVSSSADITEARRARALLSENLIDELSIGFTTVRGGSRMEKRDDGGSVWTHQRASLLEVSLVPWGAYGREATLSRSRLVDPTVEARALARASVRDWFADWRR